MAIDKKITKKVSEDWSKAFSQLSVFSQRKLYKVVGPCLIGIELIKSPYLENYSPYFVIYPLWKKDVKTSLDYPILLKDFKNIKGFQYDIPYQKHHLLFDEVKDFVKKQGPLPFEDDISFKKLESVLNEYSKTPPLSAAPNSYLQAHLEEAKMKIALYIGIAEAYRVMEKIKDRTWDTHHFNACGVDVSEWLQSLLETISKRDEFLKQIEKNKADKKISRLIKSELTV